MEKEGNEKINNSHNEVSVGAVGWGSLPLCQFSVAYELMLANTCNELKPV